MPEVLTETKPLNVVFEIGMERQRIAAERTRLEREVTEACMRAHRAERAIDNFWDQQSKKNEAAGPELFLLAEEMCEARNARWSACDALINFESSR